LGEDHGSLAVLPNYLGPSKIMWGDHERIGLLSPDAKHQVLRWYGFLWSALTAGLPGWQSEEHLGRLYHAGSAVDCGLMAQAPTISLVGGW
jgi:hypothetical protein